MTFGRFGGFLIAGIICASQAFAMTGVGVVDGTNGSLADAFAYGRFVSGSSTLGSWTLDSTVSGTDFSNDAIAGGSSGLEYVFLNEVLGSTDSNTINFSVSPNPSYSVDQLTISQSPYWNASNTWNGGNTETAQFTISWNGGGTATLNDPSNQIAGSSGGTTVSSGTTLQFSGPQIYNDVDAWNITLPSGVQDVTLDWSSVNPGLDSDLTREWVTFDSSFRSNAVPEPSSFALFGFALIGLGAFRRRR